MAERKRTAVVVCPGRGTYNKTELGYLARHHGDKRDFIASIDAYRAKAGQETVTALDGADRYSVARHTRGDNASPLIYACAYADYLAIDRDAFDIVAVTGNSMGWYIALAVAGALDVAGGLHLVNTMGTLMQETLIGGQIVYPLVDENWREVPGRREFLDDLLAEVNGRPDHVVSVSIRLGGLAVFAGNEAGLAALAEKLPPEDGRYPMRLANHAAFHSPLQMPVAERARGMLPVDLFADPALPLIDGRGGFWRPKATDTAALWDYTLGTQVVETYDYSAAIRVAMREFAPEAVIILGPGTTLGGATAQCLIGIDWQGLSSKADFASRQKRDPLILSMGIDEQRAIVTARVQTV
ncbi:MAG: ACP S-malonyltransferase [Hyphomicrobiales bacterium]|nr:ACP S-malonyltransferase [Hyphomicrobiales bacterium]